MTYAADLANARRARRQSIADATVATLESRPPDVQRAIDAACAAAFKVIVESGMPLYVGDGAADVAAVLYRRVVRGAEMELAAKQRAADDDARELALICS